MPDETPEEKLLRLIKGKSKKEKSSDLKTHEAVGGSRKPSKKRFLMSRKENILDGLARFFKNKDLGEINKILVYTAFILILFLFCDFVYGVVKPKKTYLKSLEKKVIKPPAGEPSKTEIKKKKASYYTSGMAKRNIFKPLAEKKKEGGRIALPSELIANFSLAGVIFDENPQAIIEDKRASKSYMLYAGDNIGEVKVKEVKEDRVILEYLGEDFELIL